LARRAAAAMVTKSKKPGCGEKFGGTVEQDLLLASRKFRPGLAQQGRRIAVPDWRCC